MSRKGAKETEKDARYESCSSGDDRDVPEWRLICTEDCLASNQHGEPESGSERRSQDRTALGGCCYVCW